MTQKQPPKRGRPPSLKVERVMEAALRIADAEGLGALTIRGVARDCSVTPMSIYRYVDTVEGLEELAFRKAMQNMPESDLSGPWQAQVKSIWGTFRSLLMAHPGAGAIFAKRAMPTPEIIDATARLFEILETAGFKGDAVYDLYDTTFIYTLGSIRFELTRPPDARKPLSNQGNQHASGSILSRYVNQMSDRNGETQFEIGLNAILAGLSSRAGDGAT